MEYKTTTTLAISEYSIQPNKRLNQKPLKIDQFLHDERLKFKDNERHIVVNKEKGEINKENPYLIFEKGVNLTPLPLEDLSYPRRTFEMRQNLASQTPAQNNFGKSVCNLFEYFNTKSSRTSLKSLSSSYSFHSKNAPTRTCTISSVRVSDSTEYLREFVAFGTSSIDTEEIQLEELLRLTQEDRAPSMFRLREDPSPRERKIDTKFKINLVGTETVFMLQLPSVAEPLESANGKEILEVNSLYEKGLQIVKPVCCASTQTDKVFYKTRKNCIERNSRNNSSTFVSNWEMYDTYEAISKASESKSVMSKDIMNQEESYKMEFNYLGSVFSSRLLDALMVMERLVINKPHRENQLTFSGLLVQDPLSLNVIFSYSLKHLWTFHNKKIVNQKCVTSMCWNSENHNVLAVGYGKFSYTGKSNGLVCIWNVKNPEEPERNYTLEHPVTYLEFSNAKGQILAVTLYSGLVILIDIISRSLAVIASNGHYPTTNPVWQIHWLPEELRVQGHILTCSKSGKVFRYKKTNFFTSRRIMTISKVHGKVRGVYQPRKCYARKTPTPLNPSVEVIALHPSDPHLYLVGTSEGCVYFCSVLRRNDHIEVFVAHDGPVYNIQFSPFCNKVFLTCGADWCVRVWAEGIFKPLVTLESGMTPVQDALWSVLHSTVIITITGTLIEMWDLRRNSSTPKSSIKSPSNSMNTVLLCTPNGYNVCIGDADGNVHVMGLEEMPFSPNFQEEVLIQALKNALITRPDILNELLMLGEPFFKIKKS